MTTKPDSSVEMTAKSQVEDFLSKTHDDFRREFLKWTSFIGFFCLLLVSFSNLLDKGAGDPGVMILFLATLGFAGFWYCAGRTKTSINLLSAFLICMISLTALTDPFLSPFGLATGAFSYYPTIIFISALLLPPRWSVIITVLFIVFIPLFTTGFLVELFHSSTNLYHHNRLSITIDWMVTCLMAFIVSRAFLHLKLIHQRQLIEQQTKILEVSRDRTVSIISAGIAHEFNNPLMIIKGLAEILLQSNPQSPEIVHRLHSIATAEERMEEIVRKIQILSRHHLQKEMQIIDIKSAIIRMILDLQKRGIKAQETSVIDVLTSASIKMCLEDFNIVLEQMIINALQAINEIPGEKCKILVRDHSSKWIKMTISNRTAPITQKIMDHMYDPFFTTREVGQGLGLGLPITKAVLDLYGSKIETRYQKEEKIITFEFLLPTA